MVLREAAKTLYGSNHLPKYVVRFLANILPFQPTDGLEVVDKN